MVGLGDMMKLSLMLFMTLMVLLGQGCSTEVFSEATHSAKQESEADKSASAHSNVKKETFKPAQQATYVQAEVIVSFVQGVGKLEIEQTLASVKGKIIKTVSRVRNTYLIGLPKDVSVQEAIQRLEKNKIVQYAQPNKIYKLMGK